MKHNQGNNFITIGIVSLLGALSLVLYNLSQDYQGSQYSQEVLPRVQEEISNYAAETTTTPDTTTALPDTTTIPQNDIFKEYDTTTTPLATDALVSVDDEQYLGVLYFPSLGIELPVLNEWSYDNLKHSPCRYSGSLSNGDLIIAAHNYQSHFGKLQLLNCDDEIVFEDATDTVHTYKVVQIEIVNGDDVQTMESGTDDWDLTLFTCTLSGTSRVTVRAVESDDFV